MFTKYAVALASTLALVSAGANGPISIPWGYQPSSSSKCTTAAASTVTATTTATTTKTITSVAPATTVTATATGSSGPVNTADASACKDVIAGESTDGFYDYSLIYSGALTLNPNNAGVDPNTPAYNFTYPGIYSTCQAAYAAGNDSYTQIFGNTGASGGYTFNLQYHTNTNQWTAIAYYNAALASDFNVANPNVSQSYGFVKSN